MRGSGAASFIFVADQNAGSQLAGARSTASRKNQALNQVHLVGRQISIRFQQIKQESSRYSTQPALIPTMHLGWHPDRGCIEGPLTLIPETPGTKRVFARFWPGADVGKFGACSLGCCLAFPDSRDINAPVGARCLPAIMPNCMRCNLKR